MPYDGRALRRGILVVPDQVLVLFSIDGDVVVICAALIRAIRLGGALAEEVPVHAGGREVVARAERGF